MLLFVQSLVCLGKCLRILAEHKGPDPPPQWLVHEMVCLPLCLFVHHKMDVSLSVSLSATKRYISLSVCLSATEWSVSLLQNGTSPCLSLCPLQNNMSPYQSLHLLCCILFCVFYTSVIQHFFVCVCSCFIGHLYNNLYLEVLVLCVFVLLSALRCRVTLYKFPVSSLLLSRQMTRKEEKKRGFRARPMYFNFNDADTSAAV